MIWRDDDDGRLYQMEPSGVSGFHHVAQEISVLPLDSHPVRFKLMGETIWTHGRQLVPECTAGRVIENTLLADNMELVTLGSDGSVHLYEGLAACAWVIYQSERQQLKACYVLENTSSMSSYQSELEGMYRGLMDVQSRLTPNTLQQWCENEAAVKRYNKELYKPSHVVSADADVILVIKHVAGQMAESTDIVCGHIYGHQDSAKGRGSRQTVTGDESASKDGEESRGEDDIGEVEDEVGTRQQQRPLSLEARINIECDRIANETIKAVQDGNTGPTLESVIRYTGSCALLNIDGKWMTAHQHRHITMAK